MATLVTNTRSHCLPLVCRSADEDSDRTVVFRQDVSTKRGTRMECPALANRRLQPLGHPSKHAALELTGFNAALVPYLRFLDLVDCAYHNWSRRALSYPRHAR